MPLGPLTQRPPSTLRQPTCRDDAGVSRCCAARLHSGSAPVDTYPSETGRLALSHPDLSSCAGRRLRPLTFSVCMGATPARVLNSNNNNNNSKNNKKSNFSFFHTHSDEKRRPAAIGRTPVGDRFCIEAWAWMEVISRSKRLGVPSTSKRSKVEESSVKINSVEAKHQKGQSVK